MSLELTPNIIVGLSKKSPDLYIKADFRNEERTTRPSKGSNEASFSRVCGNCAPFFVDSRINED